MISPDRSTGRFVTRFWPAVCGPEGYSDGSITEVTIFGPEQFPHVGLPAQLDADDPEVAR